MRNTWRVMVSGGGLLVLMLTTLQCANHPPAPTPISHPQSVRLLCVGNSLTRNATRHLAPIMQSAGVNYTGYVAYIGASSLAQHWQHVAAYEANPRDIAGRPYYHPSTGDRIGLREALEMQPWDVVTIQQYSWISHDVTTYRPYARQLCDYIRRYAPQAEILLHQTWAYRVDDPRFADGQFTADLMDQQLTAAYRTVAGELGIRLLPVGDAFSRAAHHPVWTYVPDPDFRPEELVYPRLPAQPHSLHVGWQWVKTAQGKQELTMDGHHANVAGEYLGGCVFFEVLTGQSVIGNRYLPERLAADDARFLQSLAHQTVAARTAR
jgi:hypothetical protein